MTTIKEEAKNYVSSTRTVDELEFVQNDMQLEDREGTDEKGVQYEYKVVVVDKIEYRVPNSVLKNLKLIMEKKPDLSKFKVLKSGTKLDTTYTVLPLD